MKVMTKKRMVSRKKKSKAIKTKSVSTKKATGSVKSKKRVIHSKSVDKQPHSKSTSKAKKKGNGPFKKGNTFGFKKGKSGNPSGRPKLGDTKHDNLIRKIRQVEHEEGVNTLENFIRRSLSSDQMAVALMKKRYPDLKSVEQITVAADSMTKQEAADIRKEIAKRFETK